MIFSKISGILPASQINDNLIILYASNPTLSTCSLISIPRPSYYDSLSLKTNSHLSTFLKSRQSIRCFDGSISWTFIEGQSLNSIYKLPKILLDEDSFKFAVHASSSLFEVQQFGRWLQISRRGTFVGHPSFLIKTDQHPVEVNAVFVSLFFYLFLDSLFLSSNFAQWIMGI